MVSKRQPVNQPCRSYALSDFKILSATHLAITGRDARRTEDAAREIRAAGGGQVDVFVADLSAQSEVRRLADEVLQRLSRIDVLVNNVGGFWNTRPLPPTGWSEPSPSTTWRRSCSPTCSLTSCCTAPRPAWSRSPPTHRPRGASTSMISRASGPTPGHGPTASPKLASVLFSYELARRLHGTSVTANAVHPGVVSTSFGAEDPATVQRVFIPFLRRFMKTPAQGAATSIYLASAPDLEQVTGRYFADSKPKPSSKLSHDRAAAARLWQISANLVGLTTAGDATSQPRLPPKI
jgi:retinol dehydrogenase 14